ncbi:MAG: thiamine pyrophosphate-binding protein [Acidobacteriota bacterium]
MTAVELFIQELKRRGVEWISTLCGHGLDPLYGAARRAGLRLIDTRNEQTAAYIAVSAGRLTRRPGVCAVSSGVAFANAMTGVVDAHLDGAPMLLISGAAAVRTAGMGHFQDLDQVALAAPATRYARVIDCPARVLHILDEAFRAAAGPVHLTFPMDVQTSEVDAASIVRPTPAPPPSAAQGDPEEVSRALERAQRPLIVAGSGIYYAGLGAELVAFSERFAIPLVVPIWDRGSVDRPVDTFMGVIGAASGGPRLLADADCIVMAGAVPDYRVGYLQPGAIRDDATVVYLNHGWGELRSRFHTAWLDEARRRRDEFRQAARKAQGRTHAVHIISALQHVLRDNTILLIDGGSIGQWAHQLLCDRYPGHWLTCGRSAVVGWGIGGAMAARLCCPDKPVILLSGDGAFTFNVADLECAVRQRLPFVAIVADDQAWGITRVGHLEKFGEPISSALGPIAFDRLAESLGARGVRVNAPAEIAPALEHALAEPAVTVIHVPITGG